MPRLRVGVTRDLRAPDGSFALGPVGLGALERAGLSWKFLAEDREELTPDLLRPFHALLHFGGAVSGDSLAGVERLALIARHGVGVDMVDLDACTEAGVAVSITPEGVRRPMASAAVALVLALAHRLVERDALVRQGRWREGRLPLVGTGLAGRVLGIVGFGRIGREVARLLRPWGMRVLVATPRLSPEEAAEHGVRRVSLEQLLRRADVCVVCCPLTPQTRGLLDARRLALMKPTALLVNVARGPIVDEGALVDALRSGRLAGAGLDVFAEEPLPPRHPLLHLDNVVLAPHALGYTDELFRGCVREACRAVLALARGRAPAHLANPEVRRSRRFREKLRALASRDA